MKTFTNIKIIGVDHGYGNIKTARKRARNSLIHTNTARVRCTATLTADR